MYNLVVKPPFDWVQDQMMYQPCQMNELVALERRHLLDEGEPQLEELTRCRAILSELAKKMPPVRVATPAEVLEHKKSAAARIRYERAFILNEQEGEPINGTNVAMFVKPEKANVLPPLAPREDMKPPRGIQYRSFRYCAELSRYLLPIEQVLWTYTEDNGLCPFAKKMNSFQIGDTLAKMWGMYEDTVFIEADHSKFDSCVTDPWIGTEELFYTEVNPSDDLHRLMQMQRFNKCYSKQGVRYKCKARKMSGEYNTSLGDTALNYAILGDVFRNVEHCKLLNGDDAVIAVRRKDLASLDLSPEMWKRYGFRTTWKLVESLEEVSFCQSQPVQLRPGVWRMVRTPARAISRTRVSVKRYENNAWYSLVASYGHCELACGDGVPMMQAWAQCLLRASLGAKVMQKEVTRRTRLEGVSRPEAREITDLARDSFARAFGISVAEQHVFEGWCDHNLLEVLPAVYPDDRVYL